eukprot:TRINITY_DN2498_c0_g1_i2.p1 TRINITY_DN2498_c0_g1~~TRINITY_DN2498_c0_g1_i2.p1  ORF type:complete len:111 (-),score=26.55 TRINITY_DN2498_c0_g1_i2:88-420(-)
MESQSLVDDHPNIDVVIIGAGMSGLFAAKTCVDAGLVVAVLEAKSRPGGRVFAEVVELDNDQVSLVNYGGTHLFPCCCQPLLDVSVDTIDTIGPLVLLNNLMMLLILLCY